MLCFSVLFCLIGFCLGNEIESKVVHIDQGSVKGYKSSKGDFFEFTGIPYATAPTGRDRFKAPLPPPQWTKTFEANKKNIFCPQVVIPASWAMATHFQEDCLVVNVFVPDTDKKNLSVLFHVHGGGYHVGYGNCSTAHALIRQSNFIFVNFNYRLGAHGFLCLGTEAVPGNAGMKDQLAALRWVKRNIVHFGGNPDDIFINGHSAGGSSVDHLMLSDTTKGLFKKVNAESGGALTPWGVQMDPIENAKLFAKRLGFQSDDIYSLEEFYKEVSYKQLTSKGFAHETDSTVVFAPCIERDVGVEMFLTKSPYEILKNGNCHKVPLLFGFTNKEGILRLDDYLEWKDDMNINFEKYLPADLKFSSEKEKREVAQKVNKFYFGDKSNEDRTREDCVDYFGDIIFAYPTVRSAKLHAEAGNKNVYLYEYSYIDDLILSQRSNELAKTIRGADHCMQSFAVLELAHVPEDLPVTYEYKQMKTLMRQLWINFYKTGKPVPKATSQFPEGWPGVTADGSPYMYLNLPSRLQNTTLFAERVRFWDKIYDKHYRLPIPPPAPPMKQMCSEL